MESHEEQRESFDIMTKGEKYECVNCGDDFEDGDGGRNYFEGETFCYRCCKEEIVGEYFKRKIPKIQLCKLLEIINSGEEL